MLNRKDIFRPFVEEDVTFKQIADGIIGVNKENYFDYTASGLAYEPIEQRLQEVLTTYANTHSEFASDARTTSFYYDIARENLKEHLELEKDFVLLPCGTGATGAIKKFQELLGLYIPPATRARFKLDENSINKPLIVIGPFEHHSNEISYREALCDTIRIPLDETGNIDLEFLAKTLEENKDREIIGAFSTASNVTGIMPPFQEISKLLRQYNAVIAFDSAASSPCLNVDSSLYDALFLSPHKLLGGPGTCGLLAIRKGLINEKESPTFAGGGTVAYVSSSEHIFNSDIEIREDAGTPAILQLIKASFAYQLRNEIGIKRIQMRKVELFKLLQKGLAEFDDYTIYGQNENHNSVGILALNFHGITPFDLCEKLSHDYGIQTRAGCSCAGPYGHDLFGISEVEAEKEKPSWLRISVNYTHSVDSIKHLLLALKESIYELKKGK
ncbi:aminotransferase class V-fold PLP-dependent enzyme [Sulfurimonas sp.]|uniref:aminotransferase class V-fold PLP-dependent enzyme n=1 Tax=Sulfurimonas sp. TaxID=2022749 RepID=UPI0025F26B94|nr:aminotransferase class V-fold PLP-dependent enzyme [Sulfurimonas sp.]